MHYLGASTLVVPAEVPRVPEVAVLLGVLAGGVAEVAVVAGGVVEPARRPQELVLVRRGVVVGAELREGPRVGAPVLVGEGEQPLGVVEEGRRVRPVDGLVHQRRRGHGGRGLRGHVAAGGFRGDLDEGSLLGHCLRTFPALVVCFGVTHLMMITSRRSNLTFRIGSVESWIITCMGSSESWIKATRGNRSTRIGIEQDRPPEDR